jgi:hypothetical protein
LVCIRGSVWEANHRPRAGPEVDYSSEVDRARRSAE